MCGGLAGVVWVWLPGGWIHVVCLSDAGVAMLTFAFFAGPRPHASWHAATRARS